MLQLNVSIRCFDGYKTDVASLMDFLSCVSLRIYFPKSDKSIKEHSICLFVGQLDLFYVSFKLILKVIFFTLFLFYLHVLRFVCKYRI